MLAILLSVRKFRFYILGRDVTVITDCTAITHVNSIKDTSNPRLVRWAIELDEYRLKLVYRPGKTNVVADFLSRYPPQEVGNICGERLLINTLDPQTNFQTGTRKGPEYRLLDEESQ